MPIPVPGPSSAPTRTVKNGIVGGLLARADELGVDPRGWFTGTALSRADFEGDSPGYLSYRQACGIIARALDTLPGDGHGLANGSRQDVGNFGIVGLAMLTAKDFGESLRIGVQYAPVAGSLLELRLEPLPDGDVAVCAATFTHEPRIEVFLVEEMFSSCLQLARGLLGPAFRPVRADFAYPPPPHVEAYDRVFGETVLFGAPAHRVVIARRWLETPMGAHHPASAKQVLALCREQMPEEQPDAAIVAAVGRLLRLQLADSPRLADIAAELHVAERTLRRRLRGAGTSWQQLRDRVRRDVAESMLRRPDARIGEVGTAIGYQDAREFRRAFKRWTGKAPSELRARR